MAKCTHLANWAKDPRTPFSYDEKTQCYELKVAPNKSIPNAHCIFCGGVSASTTESGPICVCGTLEELAQDPATAITFDSELDEFELIVGSSRKMIYFCPSCGCRKPPSKRADLFMVPSEQELSRLQERLAGVVTVEEVISRLGEPDEEGSIVEPDSLDREIYGMRTVKRTVIYRHVAQTLDVYIQEFADGKVGFAFSGKRKTMDKRDVE